MYEQWMTRVRITRLVTELRRLREGLVRGVKRCLCSENSYPYRHYDILKRSMARRHLDQHGSLMADRHHNHCRHSKTRRRYDDHRSSVAGPY